nr:unknown [Zea mays]
MRGAGAIVGYWSLPARCALPWSPPPRTGPRPPPPAVPPGLRSGLSCIWDCEMTRRAPRKNLWASSHFRAWQWH